MLKIHCVKLLPALFSYDDHCDGISERPLEGLLGVASR